MDACAPGDGVAFHAARRLLLVLHAGGSIVLVGAATHHALQMRTPLQVRFCNSWQIASDYTIEIRLGDNRVIGVRLTGATVAKPLPCDDDEPCAPVVTHPLHP